MSRQVGGPWSLLVGGGTGHDGRMGHPTVSPLVGRDAELKTLRRVLAGSRLGEPHVVLVEGEAGIGKSRLVREATTDLPADTVVLTGACSGLAHREIPWAPVTQVLTDLHQRVGPAEFTDLAGPFAGSLAPLVPALLSPAGAAVPSPGRVYAGLSHLLLGATDVAPTVVVVEDLHWADSASLGALEHLAAAARDQPIALLLTVRDGDGDPTAVHRLEDLWHARRPTRISLPRLDEDEVGVLVERLNGSTPPPGFTARVAAMSGGVPLLVEELVSSGVSESDLPAASDLVDRVAGVRMAPLDADAQRVVDAASVAFAPPTPRDLMQASGLAGAAFDSALAQALDRGALQRGEGRISFRHALVRQAVAERLFPAAEADLHLRWASVLATRTELESSTARAQHLLLADRPEDALPACLQAAEQAQRASAFPAQATLLVHVADLWPRAPDAAAASGLTLGEVLADAADASFRGADDTDRTAELIRRARACTGAEAPRDGLAWLGLLWMMCRPSSGLARFLTDDRLVGASAAEQSPTSSRSSWARP